MIIFLGGIHGAGKGTLAKEISKETFIPHFSASKILKWEEVSPNLQNKNVDDISFTQDRLILGLRILLEDHKDILLDGHFCLFNKNQEPEKVPLETFKDINPRILLVVENPPEIIRDRILSRDGKQYKLSLLVKMQKMELDHAQEIAFQLNIPLWVIEQKISQKMIEEINKMCHESLT